MAQHTSWIDLLDTSNSCSSDVALSPSKRLKKFTDENSDTQEMNQKRNIKIEIDGESNEKKFDELVTNNKIKSPFKRRLSNERLTEVQIKIDTPSRQKGKRSKLDSGNDEMFKTERGDADDELEDGEILDESMKISKKRLRCESSSSSSSGSFQNREIETDAATLERRQKQIDYGKNTIGYDNYVNQVPKYSRTRDHPKTPPKHLKYSRRAWEGLIKSWRKKLHTFDPQDSKIEQDDNATGF